MFSYFQYIIYSCLNAISYFPKYFFLPNLPPRGGFRRLGIALRGSCSGIRNGFRSVGIKGEEVFRGAVEFHAAAGGVGDFLTEAHVVEAGFYIEDAESLRVQTLRRAGESRVNVAGMEKSEGLSMKEEVIFIDRFPGI